MLAMLMLGGLPTSSAAPAGNETKPCGILLNQYQEVGKLADFKIALRCGSDQKEAFPINEPLVIGLTATTSDKRENDEVEIEYDFPLQNIVVPPQAGTLTFTFHAQLSDISGKTYVFAKVWPRAFLQDCADGRPGCMKYGYALGMPNSLSEVCFKKDEDGNKEFIDSFACRGSDNYRFKFR